MCKSSNLNSSSQQQQPHFVSSLPFPSLRNRSYSFFTCSHKYSNEASRNLNALQAFFPNAAGQVSQSDSSRFYQTKQTTPSAEFTLEVGFFHSRFASPKNARFPKSTSFYGVTSRKNEALIAPRDLISKASYSKATERIMTLILEMLRAFSDIKHLHHRNKYSFRSKRDTR